MSRVDEILTNVRYSLSDPSGTRWSTDRLLRLINDCQLDLTARANLLRAKTNIKLYSDIAEYELASDALLLTRAVDIEGEKISIVSHDVMDVLDPNWEVLTSDSGEIEKIVFDNVNPRYIKVYPIPLEDTAGEVFISSDYGVTVDIEGDVLTSDYGIVVDVSSSATDDYSFNSVYGVMVGMEETLGALNVYYTRRPANVLTTLALEIDPRWDLAIQHYTKGMCLRDDQDTQNVSVGNSELALYELQVKEAEKQSMKNNSAGAEHQTSYNGGI